MEDGDLLKATSLYQKAEAYYDTANEQRKRLDCQKTRAAVYNDIGRKTEATDLLRQVIASCEGDTALNGVHGEALFELGKIEMDNEEFRSAIQHLEQSYNILQDHNPAYARMAANNLHNLYTYKIPDAAKASFWLEKSNHFMEHYIADDEVRAYKSATENFLTYNYPEARDTISALISRCKAHPNFPPTRLSEYYKTLALIQQQGLKQYNLSEQNYKQALSLAIEAGEAGKEDLPEIWYELTLLYGNWGKPDEAMTAANNCVKATLDYYGPWHSETMKAYSMRSNFAGFYNLRDTALNDRRKCFDIIGHNIAQNFVYLTASERSAYWNKFLEETTIMFTFAHKLEEFQSEYTDELFNQQLMAKGLLLNAESALQRAVNENTDLNASYQKIRQLRLLAEAAGTDPYEAGAANMEADRLERELGSAANALYQSMNFLKINNKDVRDKLKPTELAIEFVDYRVGKDSVMYAALIMSPKWTHVRFLPLIEKRELMSLQTGLADRIWQPILNIAPAGVTTLYFAPTGELYQLPIESQMLKNGKLISDLYKLYRMSSTRWLAYKGDPTVGKDAVVYGGLKYNASVNDMLADAQTYPRRRGEERQTDNLRWSVDTLDFLPGTETEAKEIVEVINRAGNSGLHAEAYLGQKGTETSFKALDGQKKRIVHVATHGFYQEGTPQESADLNNALTRCGLFFAGADNKRMGESLPAKLDDGILTAEEIAQMDLRGLDIVVLSACQTGQGQISSDGVFGLQRGFKKAGANSILMSLWKVDDAATCLLMTEFYKNWTSGMSKHDALERAKETVRNYAGKDWSAPKYWAAFILLDGLD